MLGQRQITFIVIKCLFQLNFVFCIPSRVRDKELCICWDLEIIESPIFLMYATCIGTTSSQRHPTYRIRNIGSTLIQCHKTTNVGPMLSLCRMHTYVWPMLGQRQISFIVIKCLFQLNIVFCTSRRVTDKELCICWDLEIIESPIFLMYATCIGTTSSQRHPTYRIRNIGSTLIQCYKTTNVGPMLSLCRMLPTSDQCRANVRSL